jgi:hypothetical protein
VRIAIIAWGSLVWDPRELQVSAGFAPIGPFLPIEFCRVSRDGRLTLAVDETFGTLGATYSAPSAFEKLDVAIKNLKEREGMHSANEVGFVELAADAQSETAMQRHPQAVATIAAWTQTNRYDAAIWTALASNFEESDKGGEPFSVTAAISYLEALEKRDAAKFRWALNYIRRAPVEVQTPVREEVQKRWPA